DAVILAVAHQEFEQMGAEQIRALCKQDGVLFDVKYLLPPESVDGRL
ncbi:MAG: Vi polysaccharide biosynthesis UDP-N-acetylglucosamine C-6 dehydrogenase TviB, partial [Gammaproteobacteria bacterium]|nr:Vi polysaccharide biosynthesis UDP-N-acetylglucosamine C-6 dehydrogenase TviB [Gammaproteobacteria bacterium]